MTLDDYARWTLQVRSLGQFTRSRFGSMMVFGALDSILKATSTHCFVWFEVAS
ncbi:hypothetical protein [Leptolyngbya sp. GGD]|uniref:hypothetical protein n=1 Tax=Leptolyngbya sp. GGD TaxID=2997907 RepID=UPI00227BA5F1|nr:hypothetical protein [Leptolyngbya sp. GGD]MCY6491900.1 hypothetical protein [Leptolyngbya sp. GGD]